MGEIVIGEPRRFSLTPELLRASMFETENCFSSFHSSVVHDTDMFAVHINTLEEKLGNCKMATDQFIEGMIRASVDGEYYVEALSAFYAALYNSEFYDSLFEKNDPRELKIDWFLEMLRAALRAAPLNFAVVFTELDTEQKPRLYRKRYNSFVTVNEIPVTYPHAFGSYLYFLEDVYYEFIERRNSGEEGLTDLRFLYSAGIFEKEEQIRDSAGSELWGTW